MKRIQLQQLCLYSGDEGRLGEGYPFFYHFVEQRFSHIARIWNVCKAREKEHCCNHLPAIGSNTAFSNDISLHNKLELAPAHVSMFKQSESCPCCTRSSPGHAGMLSVMTHLNGNEVYWLRHCTSWLWRKTLNIFKAVYWPLNILHIILE